MVRVTCWTLHKCAIVLRLMANFVILPFVGTTVAGLYKDTYAQVTTNTTSVNAPFVMLAVASAPPLLTFLVGPFVWFAADNSQAWLRPLYDCATHGTYIVVFLFAIGVIVFHFVWIIHLTTVLGLGSDLSDRWLHTIADPIMCANFNAYFTFFVFLIRVIALENDREGAWRNADTPITIQNGPTPV